jgi:hypothetical protein
MSHAALLLLLAGEAPGRDDRAAVSGDVAAVAALGRWFRWAQDAS